MKNCWIFLCLSFFILSAKAQVSIPWNSYTSGSLTYTVNVSCVTMTSSTSIGGATEWYSTGGPFPQYGYGTYNGIYGYVIWPDWNLGSGGRNIVTTMNFFKNSVAHANTVSFNIYDINAGACGTLSSNRFIDSVVIYGFTAAGTQVKPNSVTCGCADNYITSTSNTTIIRGYSTCGEGANSNYATIQFTTAVKTVVVAYAPGKGNPGTGAACGGSTNYPLNSNQNPRNQYIKIGDINFGASCILPVELLSFNAECSPNSIRCSWTTASEKNNDFFTLERSTDGSEWNTIAKVKGAGTKSTPSHYSVEGLDAGDGQDFFRLVQTDFDGTVTELTPVSVNCGKKKNELIMVYPNPSNGIFYFDLLNDEEETFSVTLTDLLGNTVWGKNETASEGINRIRVDAAGIDKAVYFLNIRSASGKNYYGRIIIQ